MSVKPDRPETPEEWKRRVGVGRPSSAFRRMGSGPGSSRSTPVAREDKPGVAGVRTEHWDGRQDATVFAEHTRVQGKAIRG